MSQEHQQTVNISKAERNKLEKARKKAVEEARRKVEELQRKAVKAQKEVLGDLKKQAKQISKEKAKLNSLLDWKKNIGNQVNTEIEKISQSKEEIEKLNYSLDNSETQLTKLRDYEKQLHTQIDILHDNCATTKQEATNMKDLWNSEFIKSQTNTTEVKELFKEGNILGEAILTAFDTTNSLIQDIEYEEAINTQNFAEIEKQESAYHQVNSELSFIDTHDSLSTSAFVTLQAMKNKEYELREVISGEELTAWFEKIDEKGKKKEVFVKLSKSFHESEAWLEELDISKGFIDDECLDEGEDIIEEMEKLGVKYDKASSKYPLPPKNSETEWQRKLRNRTTNRQKRKN